MQRTPSHFRLTAAAFAASLAFVAATPTAATAVPGDLDPSFASGGKFVQPIGARHTNLNAAVRQPDGKIVAVGFAEQAASAPFNRDFLVVRLNANGTPDNTFGGGTGIVQSPITPTTQDDTAFAVALGPGGTIYVAGTTDPAGAGDSADFAVARYTSTGVLDGGFSTNGIQTHSIGTTIDRATAIVVQGDGKPVIAGAAGSAEGGFNVLRLDGSTGALDGGFNAAGTTPGVQEIVFTSGFGIDNAAALALPGGDKILVAGTADLSSASDDFALARLNSDGSLDTAGFGAGTGKVQSVVAGKQMLTALTLDPSGRIVVAGTESSGGIADFRVARYLASGAPDNSFSGDGAESTPFVIGGTRFALASGVQVQADGRILAGGSAFVCGGTGCADFALARYNTGGSLDPSFGSGGRRTYGVGAANDFSTGLLLGSFLQVGFSFDAVAGRERAVVTKGQTTGSAATPPPTTSAPPPFFQRPPCRCLRLSARVDPKSIDLVNNQSLSFVVRWKITCTNGRGGCKGTIRLRNPGGLKKLKSKFGRAKIGCSGPCDGSTNGKSKRITLIGDLNTAKRRAKLKKVRFPVEFSCSGRKPKKFITFRFTKHGFVDKKRSRLRAR